MFNASSRFFEAIQDSHTVATRVEVYAPSGELLVKDLEVLDGNVSVDRTTSARRTASVKMTDRNGLVTPRDANDLFHPLASNYIRLYRGVKFGTVLVPETRTRFVKVLEEAEPDPWEPDQEEVPAPEGHTRGSNVFTLKVEEPGELILESYTAWIEEDDAELVPQGVFDIFDSNVDDTRDSLTVELKLFDLSRKVERARLLSNFVIPAGTNYGDAIKSIIDGGVPDLSYRFPEVDYLTPRLVFGASGDQEGGDRWKYAREMAESIGHDLSFDRDGSVRLKEVPLEKSQPVVWDYSEGDRAMLLYSTRNLSKEATYNHVVAVGESTSNDEPIKGEAMDDDPSSPTYVGDPYGTGPYGAVPFFLRSKYIRTEPQGDQAALAKLKQLQGTTEHMRIITTVNPAHNAGDRIRIVRSRSKVDGRFVIDKFNVPLQYSGPMNMTMRETRRV